MTARETLHFTARFFYTGPTAALAERVAEMLELVGLSEKADRTQAAIYALQQQLVPLQDALERA